MLDKGTPPLITPPEPFCPVGAAVVEGGEVIEEVGVEVVEVEPGAEAPLVAPPPDSVLVGAAGLLMPPRTSLDRRLTGGFGEESLSDPGDWLVGGVRGVALGVETFEPPPRSFRRLESRCDGRTLRTLAASASRAV